MPGKPRQRPRPCAFNRHRPVDFWIMRPAWVGAGIRISKVHFDQACAKCGHNARTVWADIEGDTTPMGESMTLVAWLEANAATVRAPAEGEVRAPDAAEIAAILERVPNVVP